MHTFCSVFAAFSFFPCHQLQTTQIDLGNGKQMLCCINGSSGCVSPRSRMTQLVLVYTRQPNLHTQFRISSISLVQLHFRQLSCPHGTEIYMAFPACGKIILIIIIYQGLVCICNFDVTHYQLPSAIFPCLDIEAFITRILSSCFIGSLLSDIRW